MSFGNILGEIMQNGLGGASQTRTRVDNAASNLGGRGGSIDGIFSQLQSALGGATGTTGTGGPAGGFADKARDFLQKEQMGGLSGAQVGGIGAVAGALLGGGLGGAAKGGAMAVLGTLALGALKSARARADAADPGAVSVEPEEVQALVGPDTERLVLRAMIQASKSDGKIDASEMQAIISRLGDDSVTAEEKQFVLAEMQAPVDVRKLAAEVKSPAQAAEVYAASILTIHADTEPERQYLRDLAGALGLDPATVRELHEMTGAPS